MAGKNILWSPRAARSYANTIQFILKKWTLKEAKDLDKKLEKFLSLISSQDVDLSKLGKPKGKYFHFVLAKQTTIVYQFLSPDTIELVAFLDNRKKPKS